MKEKPQEILEQHEEEPKTVKDYVDIVTGLLECEFYLTLKTAGRMSEKRADKLAKSTIEKALKSINESIDPKLKKALETTELPFPKVP